MKRRLLLPGALCAAAGAAFVQCDSPETPKRPNIVYIMSDDHAVQAISAYGHPLSQVAPTPNIDRLAAEGVRFDRAYCGNSVSGPSRATILTGKHSFTNGFRTNADVFDSSQLTLPKVLQQNGYATAVIGKWHLKSYPSGFDYWKVLDDQGMYYNPDFVVMSGDTVRQRGYVTDIVADESIEWIEQHKDQPFFIMVHNKAPHRNFQPAPRHLTLHEHTFFPYPDNLLDNHEGRIAAQRQEMSIAQDMMPAYDLKLYTRKEEWDPKTDWGPDYRFMDSTECEAYKASYDAANQTYYDNPPTGDSLTRWKFQRYMRDYFSTIAAVDENVGKILDYLEQAGLAENTIVVYASDQSFYLGEHGWFDKRFMYEQSMRMPLLIRYPREIPAGTEARTSLVQNIDFAPTLLDWCGIEKPAEMQGESFRAIATGGDSAVEPGTNWRNTLYYRYFENPGIHNVMQHAGVFDGRWKLIYFYSNETPVPTEHFFELYDLESDPDEMHNLYGTPETAAETARLMKELNRLATYYNETLPPCAELDAVR
ncbi:sulfatase family protein [Millionella massiliensis]|uniref:sulfatase family protein n=1 Tax=Millionella massiliensis TaxID=1871023 RepID=UPI0023A89993|nr:sulfatase [Millionella massiliensis]